MEYLILCSLIVSVALNIVLMMSPKDEDFVKYIKGFDEGFNVGFDVGRTQGKDGLK